MGNTSKKLASKCALLSKDEQKSIARVFKAASKNSDNLKEEELIKTWGPQIDPRLAQYLSNFLFGAGADKSPTCTFHRFAELYVFNVRGTVDERVVAIYNHLGREYQENAELPYQLLREYCESLVSTYIKMVKQSTAQSAAKWIEKGFRGKASQVQALGEAVAAVISETDSVQTQCTSVQVYRWIQSNTLLQSMAELVFVNLFGIDRKMEDTSPDADVPPSLRSLLPVPDGIDAMPDYPAFIDLSHIVWLNNHIPLKHQHKWRFLFSSHIHGESFSTMAGRIQDVGPSLLIIEDTNGYIFGGYASQSWTVSPSFYGSEESFLFTLSPRMRMYRATNYNNHYQYMNQNTRTLPNGLMMGGQFDFGGIWINADPFGQGSSAETCSTYRGYKRLSKEPTFKIASLEVWGVGVKPLSVKESGERETSVLDVNPEAKAILDMAGRTRHSEGIREPPPL